MACRCIASLVSFRVLRRSEAWLFPSEWPRILVVVMIVEERPCGSGERQEQLVILDYDDDCEWRS